MSRVPLSRTRDAAGSYGVVGAAGADITERHVVRGLIPNETQFPCRLVAYCTSGHYTAMCSILRVYGPRHFTGSFLSEWLGHRIR